MYRGSLVKLRGYNEKDIPKLLHFINEPDIKKNIDSGIPYIYTRKDQEKIFEKRKENEDYIFAIESLDHGKFIGGACIKNIDWKNSHCEIALFISPNNWGNGFGLDTLKILLKFVFQQMNLNKIKLKAYSFNKRAQSIYKKIGFKEEGALREEIFRDGEYHDEFIFGLLKKEYKI